MHYPGTDNYPSATEGSRQEFTDLLALSFQQLGADRAANNEETNDHDADAGIAVVQVTFLQRAICWWFMKPLQSKDGGAMRKGPANENRVIKTLGKYVSEFSKGKYKVKNIHTYGLLARHDVQACASSPDRLFGLLERSDDGSYKFVGLCVL